MANGLDPDLDRRSVGSDLGPNCLQRLSADGKPPLAMKELHVISLVIQYSSSGYDLAIDSYFSFRTSIEFYQSPLILTELFQHDLINVSYLTACYLYQVMMTLHFLNDVANDAESTQK